MASKVKQRHKMELRAWDKEKKKLLKAAKKDAAKKAAVEERERSLLAAHDAELRELLGDAVIEEAQAPQEAAHARKKGAKSKRELKREAKLREEEQFASAFEEASREGPRADEIRLLGEKLRALGLRVHQVPPDGNCMFNAVAHQLGDAVTAAELRASATEHLGSRAEEYAAFLAEGVSYEAYVDKMRSNSEWGGQLELVALAKSLKRRIVVFSAHAPELVVNEECEQEDPLRVSYHKHFISSGEHYNSVVVAAAE